MLKDLKQYLSKILKENIANMSSVSGGDISQAYRIETANNNYFLKLNSAPNALTLFQTESYGLDCIAKTNSIKTPKAIACNTFEGSAFLLMEFVASKSPASGDFKVLGKQLAALHQCTSEHFGLDQDNCIGKLHQSNTQHNTWVDFYTHERLLPQLHLAKNKGLLNPKKIPGSSELKSVLDSLFKNVKPALLHGDLWSGNYLIATDGTPYVIDPAVYYGHHEVDIAMSKLFGGFGDAFYESYFSIIPENENTSARIDLSQLYYLLVHLNMFGRSYYGSVRAILKTYF